MIKFQRTLSYQIEDLQPLQSLCTKTMTTSPYMSSQQHQQKQYYARSLSKNQQNQSKELRNDIKRRQQVFLNQKNNMKVNNDFLLSKDLLSKNQNSYFKSQDGNMKQIAQSVQSTSQLSNNFIEISCQQKKQSIKSFSIYQKISLAFKPSKQTKNKLCYTSNNIKTAKLCQSIQPVIKIEKVNQKHESINLHGASGQKRNYTSLMQLDLLKRDDEFQSKDIQLKNILQKKLQSQLKQIQVNTSLQIQQLKQQIEILRNQKTANKSYITQLQKVNNQNSQKNLCLNKKLEEQIILKQQYFNQIIQLRSEINELRKAQKQMKMMLVAKQNAINQITEKLYMPQEQRSESSIKLSDTDIMKISQALEVKSSRNKIPQVYVKVPTIASVSQICDNCHKKNQKVIRQSKSTQHLNLFPVNYDEENSELRSSKNSQISHISKSYLSSLGLNRKRSSKQEEGKLVDYMLETNYPSTTDSGKQFSKNQKQWSKIVSKINK